MKHKLPNDEILDKLYDFIEKLEEKYKVRIRFNVDRIIKE